MEKGQPVAPPQSGSNDPTLNRLYYNYINKKTNKKDDENEDGETLPRIDPKYAIGYTRLLDNHFDPKIHPGSWKGTSHLRDYKYTYNDSGLGFKMVKGPKMERFPERHELKEAVTALNKDKKGFRWFREYESVYNNDIIVTIEYCTNCMEHQGSTRHDEEKYAYFANALKREIVSQYPVIKVVLKPLIIPQGDESVDAHYLRSRIGAMEVQVFSKNYEGQQTRQIVFSKLKSKSWPSISKVVDDISDHLPKNDFIVKLIDPSGDTEENKGDSPQKKSNRLKGLYVVMRPVKTDKRPQGSVSEFGSRFHDSGRIPTQQGTSRPTSGQHMRPHSGASGSIRPTSAISTTSMKSNLSKKTMKEAPPSYQQKEYVEQADNFGVVQFKKIPNNSYEIEILETQDFLPMTRQVNIFEFIENGQPLRLDVVLQDQTMSFCRIKIIDSGMGGSPFGGAAVVVAKKNPEPDSKTARLNEKEPNNGIFEFMIDPGEYVLTISKGGFPERKELIVATKGVKDITIDVKNPPTYYPAKRPESSKGRAEHANASASKTNVGNLDVIPQEESPAKTPLGTRNNHQQKPHVEEDKNAANKPERVKSALVKKVEFVVHDVDTEKPVSGAVILLEEIQQQFTTNEEGKCLIPVNKLNQGKLYLNHENFFGMVEEYGGEDGIDFKNVPQKKFYLIPRPSNDLEIQLRFLPGGDAADQPRVKCARFDVLSNDDAKNDIVVKHCDDGREIITLKNLYKKHGVFRITAEILNIDEFLHPESTFILSRYEDCEPLYIFPPPDELVKEGTKLYWDVGFFADPAVNQQFVEINGYSNSKIEAQSHLKEYQMLLNYLNNSKSDLKTVLGFKGPQAVEKDGDVFITSKNLYASLDKYGLEVKNLDHLLSSARSVEGLYSFRECERRFGSLKPPFNFIKDDFNDGTDGDDGEAEYLDDNEDFE